jgi:ABC-type dipeptide/oligopeptide/nickel transport system permease component
LTRYVLRRLGISALTVLGLVLVVFLVTRILPGDAAAARLGPEATADDIAALRAQYGLDDPLLVQLRDYLVRLAQGDLGQAVSTGRDVGTELFARLPATIELALAALVVAVVIGLPLGVLAAAHRGRTADGVARVYAVLGSSMAPFWLGLLLIYGLFSVAHLLPGPTGRLPIGAVPPPEVTGMYVLDALLAGDPGTAWQALRYLALPALTLGIGASAAVVKMVRSALIATQSAGYVRTALAFGVAPRTVLWRDRMRNAMLAILTSLGLVFSFLLGGNVIVEQLFSWPGMGRLAYDAVRANDLEILQGYAIVIGVLYIALNFVIDLAYAAVDPRIRLGGARA